MKFVYTYCSVNLIEIFKINKNIVLNKFTIIINISLILKKILLKIYITGICTIILYTFMQFKVNKNKLQKNVMKFTVLKILFLVVKCIEKLIFIYRQNNNNDNNFQCTFEIFWSKI